MTAHTSPAEHLLLIVAGCGALGVYGLGWLRRRDASVTRLAAWATAIVATLAATAPVVEVWAARSFTGHMGQHLGLIVVAAPLFVVAQPVRTIRELFTVRVRPGERSVARWWHRNGVLLAPLLFLGVLYLTHLTQIYERALGNRFVHDLEHLAYVGSAVALWAAIQAPAQRVGAARVGAAMGVIGGTALLGVVLLSASQPLVPTYLESLGADAALDDQRRAASFMWAGGMGLTLPLLLSSVWIWASAEERLARRTEALTDRAAAVPPTGTTAHHTTRRAAGGTSPG
ncbi:MAG: cytochrome c oxidase assembly protein [Acidimicrobiia bacterium]|nr:cytochrome c oxidase assembly protein [Acidimicrobiia bacterium]